MLGGASLGAATLSGEAIEIASEIVHPNGNVYDQVLMWGAFATVRADPGQVVRVSFVDLTDDIVQVEFSGKGLLGIFLADASGLAPAVKYNQPGVDYMRGHASLRIEGSHATTNLSVFSVGRLTAVNQTLSRSDITYDGFADIAWSRSNRTRPPRGPGELWRPAPGRRAIFRVAGIHRNFHARGERVKPGDRW